MKANVGTLDKIIRYIIGLALIVVLGLIYHSWWGLIGILPVISAVTGFCGFYLPFGINTHKNKPVAQ
jgi:hypothetical protein